MNIRPYVTLVRNAEGGDGGSTNPAPVADGSTPPAGGDGAGSGNPAPGGGWFTALPEDLRANPSVAKFADQGPEALAHAYANAAKLIGVSPDQVIRLEEARGDIPGLLRKLGAPEAPDGYEFKAPEGVPEHLAAGENLTWFREQAAKIGLLPQQAEALYTSFVERNIEAQKQVEQYVDQARDTLQREWGQAFDSNIAAASRAARTLGLTEALNQAGLGADPNVIKALVRVDRALGGAGEGAGPAAGSVTPLAPADASAKARALQGQALEAFRNGNRAEADRLRQEASRYYAMAG